jgi:hypothetical protein
MVAAAAAGSTRIEMLSLQTPEDLQVVPLLVADRAGVSVTQQILLTMRPVGPQGSAAAAVVRTQRMLQEVQEVVV